jgi:cation diffusion facilitator CzcD-associated flavoprotein CzcO
MTAANSSLSKRVARSVAPGLTANIPAAVVMVCAAYDGLAIHGDTLILTTNVTVWSHLYSYSFAPNPDWTREYPGQEEIHAHLVNVALKWGLYRYIRFNTEVDEARWDESSKSWKTSVTVSGGKDAEFSPSYTITSNILVSAVGQLNQPYYPKIDGLDSFKGKVMHSARWDWSYDFAGKKIALIGNGATAAQILPEIVKTAESVTMFQRTPNWVIPRDDKPISETMRRVYRYVPGVRKTYRAALMDARESFFEAAAVGESQMNTTIRQLSLGHMANQIPADEGLRKALTPDYPPGCKRIIISDDFFPAINDPKAKLETRPIDHVTASGITVAGTGSEYDLIILATGFRTLEFMYPIKVYGLNGTSIEDIWRGGAQAFIGMTVAQLPNFAMLYGPNTNLGHNSIILMIEAQSRYITTLIRPVLKSRASAVSSGGKSGNQSFLPKPDRVKEYNAEIQARLQKSTFSNSSCRSWYKNAEGTVTNNWCGTATEYQIRTSVLDWNDYIFSGQGKESDQQPAKKQENIGRVVEGNQSSIAGLVGKLVLGAALVVDTACTSMGSLLA